MLRVVITFLFIIPFSTSSMSQNFFNNTVSDTLEYSYLEYQDELTDSTKEFNSFIEIIYSYPSFIGYKTIMDSISYFIFGSIKTPPDIPKHLRELILKTKYYLDNESHNDRGVYENFSVKVVFNEKNILTLQFQEITYYGGMHRQTYLRFKCFKLNEEKQLKLSDLFNKNFYNELTKIAKNEFYNLMGLAKDADLKKERFWFDENRFHLNNNFYINSDGLHFFYNNYEIRAYSAGSTDLVIPWYKIEHLLNDKI